MTNNDIINSVCTVEARKWRPLELFRTVYPDDDDFNCLDALYPGRIGTIYKNDKGEIEKIVIHRTWPHELGSGDEEETGLYGPSDE